ncbi:MAG: XdhC family protein [Paludibacterium sp.]|uniref:XdhC family protein n=1 Tax=Paludibacterium sp. TaxID=1917523 RepID=UPI0025E985C4|nr:XdhC/CoxI family protein [Paludibacterium sp.]MBV8045693.1 XdhC family protein [Paludibacterium sp.]MBV8646102.1 XdhC family protein [Paludibacterium sp.]
MDIYEEIIRLRGEGRNAALATITNTQGSIPSFATAKMLVRDDGSIVGTVGGGGAEWEAIQAAREVIAREKPVTISFDLNKQPGLDAGMVCGGSLEIYIEPLVAAPALYIFGAGHTGRATYQVALPAGFDVIVVDEREAFANRENYPQAKDIVVADYDTAMSRLAPRPNDFILILTPSHMTDMRVLRWATGTAARYIGMIGSKRKVTGIFHELQKEGIAAERFGNVHAPVGLDIGAQTPEEIAISILAEMVACRRRSEAALPHLGLALPSAEDIPLKKKA